MAKYKKKPVIVEAEPYKEGMEDGWDVLYTGNFIKYIESFKTKEECLEFIQRDKGREECDTDDMDDELIYEEPIPYIMTIKGKRYINTRMPDMIVTEEDGNRYPHHPLDFNLNHDKIEDESNSQEYSFEIGV